MVKNMVLKEFMMNLEKYIKVFFIKMELNKNNVAESGGFEPTEAFTSPVFKTGAINHSTTPPLRPTCSADQRLDFATTRPSQQP